MTDVPDPRVELAIERMGELADRPPAEHVAVYDDVHRTLQEVLAQAAEDDPVAVPGQDAGR